MQYEILIYKYSVENKNEYYTILCSLAGSEHNHAFAALLSTKAESCTVFRVMHDKNLSRAFCTDVQLLRFTNVRQATICKGYGKVHAVTSI